MNERSQYNKDLPLASAEQDILALIRKMQQQLVFLEKKIDILVNQSQARPFREKHFSKPFRSFDRPHRHSDRAYVNAPGEKNIDRGRHFERRDSEENRGFDHKKKDYDNSRESDFSKGQHFQKQHDGEKRGFYQKKNPFSYRRKDHR